MDDDTKAQLETLNQWCESWKKAATRLRAALHTISEESADPYIGRMAEYILKGGTVEQYQKEYWKEHERKVKQRRGDD